MDMYEGWMRFASKTGIEVVSTGLELQRGTKEKLRTGVKKAVNDRNLYEGYRGTEEDEDWYHKILPDTINKITESTNEKPKYKITTVNIQNCKHTNSRTETVLSVYNSYCIHSK